MMKSLPGARYAAWPAACAVLALCSAHAAGADPSAGAPRLYVSDERGGNVVIVDPQSASVIARIPVGKRPRGIQVSPDHKRVYVALSGSPMGGPNVDESKLPPPDRRYDGIGVVDVGQRKLTGKISAGSDPEEFAVSKDGTRIYVSNEDIKTATVINIASGKVERIRVVATSFSRPWLSIGSSSDRLRVNC